MSPIASLTVESEMSSEMVNKSPGNITGDLNFKETELTLGLPGGSGIPKSGIKRGFSETVDLNLGGSVVDESQGENFKNDVSEKESSEETKPSKEKAQAVGWPPVRSFRKNMMKKCKYVKVAVDGAPYLRKADLELYNSYQELLNALNEMFSCFTIRNYLNDGKLVDSVNGSEYVPTYEDKDGDWMLVGDVPWSMFVESCKRLRLMKSSEAHGLAPRTPPRNSSTTTSG